MRYSNNLQLTMLFAVVFAGVAHAAPAVINFEGFGTSNEPLPEGTPVSSVERQGVTVNFLTQADNGKTTIPFIAEFGRPRVGFQSVISDEQPVNENTSDYLAGGS
jgi:hypothetical protein